MRARPPAEPGQSIERAGGVVRTRGRYNMICYSALRAADSDRAVAEQAAYFRERGEEVEWKLYSHDMPSDLGSVLAAHGFERGEAETLMVLPLTETLEAVRDTGIEIRAAASSLEIAAYVDVMTAAFGEPPSWSAEDFQVRLFGERADTIGFVAYLDGEPAAAGRLELPRERSFASIWGGGTRPPMRNRGVYRALVLERARIARERGYAYLTVDARETSRPILERLGFIPLATVHAWVLRPPTTGRTPLEGAPP